MADPAAVAATLHKDPATLSQVLAALTNPDTNAIKAAEDVLRPFLKKASCVKAIVQQAGECPNPAVRQLAATVLRKPIAKLWTKLKPEVQGQVKAMLIEAMTREAERPVRHQIASLSAALARIVGFGRAPAGGGRSALMAAQARSAFADKTGGGWPELLQFINTCAMQADTPQHRELAYYLLSQLAETVGQELAQHFAELAALFQHALADADGDVSKSAMRAAAKLISELSIEKDVLQFGALVPPMCALTLVAAQRGDDEALAAPLEAFTDIAMSPVKVIDGHVKPVIELMRNIVTPAPPDHLTKMTRSTAAELIETLGAGNARERARARAPNGYGRSPRPPLPLCARARSREQAQAARARGARAAARQGARRRDRRDEDQRRGRVLPVLAAAAAQGRRGRRRRRRRRGLGRAERAGDGAEHARQARARGADEALLRADLPAHLRVLRAGHAADVARGGGLPRRHRRGRAGRIREQLPQVLAMLARAAEHGDATTRECVCFAYGQLAEHCQPEILAHHRQVLPVVFALMDTGAESVMGISCHVLETFCESMEEQHVVPILDDLATKLLVLLQHPKPSLREMAAAAIGTTALAAKEAFLPYLDRTARPLCQYASENLGSEAEYELRGRALEALGYLGMAVGNDAFEPYLGAANASATQNLTMDSLDLAEFTCESARAARCRCIRL